MGRRPKIEVPKISKFATPERVDRDQQMFLDWLSGLSYVAIGVKHSMHKNSVLNISKQYNWPKLKQQLAQRQWAAVLGAMDRTATLLATTLESDVRKIAKKFQEGEALTSGERDHMRSLLDRLLKEHRLEAGKPTEIASGPVQVELKLPPGVKNFGVIPTTGRTVNVVETEPSDEGQGPVETLNLDDVEAQLGEEDEDGDEKI